MVNQRSPVGAIQAGNGAESTVQSSDGAAEAAGRVSRYRYFVLLILTITYTVSLIDRQLIAIMIEPVRRDLHLSDTQIGLLSGLAFGLFYALAAIPLSRIADSWSKSRLIAGCLCLWSIATAVCGLAGSFVHIFIARVIIGASEGGASSTSQALLADHFPPRQRATALGVYAVGVHVGAGLSLVLGGLSVHILGWRQTFLILGIPGIILALVLFLTLHDVHDHRRSSVRDALPGFTTSLRIVAARPVLLLTACGYGLSILASQALLNWFPAYMMRYYGLSAREVGLRMGLVAAASGAIGVALGGKLADILARKRPANRAHVAAGAIIAAVPMGVLSVSGLSEQQAFVWFGAYVFVAGFVAGPAFAIVQNVAPPALRSLAAAVASATTVVIGQAVGPFAPGFLSDIMARFDVAQPLRAALIAVISCSAAGAIVFLGVAASIQRDEERSSGQR
ncbi:MFS transporter [Burkholderia sp. KCJ3K979]|uniref:spinster family MFS transporter n=1 Tax=Burkholderia sp. KCJ3K979 TaxID=2759149 RepID=UPI001929D2BC|nr:MFS transporter [Burkholderia sp. KCJ3K979]MBL3960990.1 MFS transporter [Burkholderia sp. KCJ3K979]